MIKLPYKFVWQNPGLRKAMYPLREQKLRDFLLIYDEADLVKKYSQKPPAERVALVRAELQPVSARYESMGHDELLDTILGRFDADITYQRYPEWLRYAAVHFSGIRYKSAHGSWENPDLLIAKLEDMLRETLKKASLPQLQEMNRKSGLPELTADLEEMKRALFNHLTAQEIVQSGPSQEAARLASLERLLMMKERMQFPGWFWKEVVSHTDLRLAIQKGDWLNDWENLSLVDIRERSQTRDYRWQTVLNLWKQDSTAWRQKHFSDLSLVVTRVVCNELSEHIHHVNGLKPAAGLTAKPVWYKNLMGMPDRAPTTVRPGMQKEKDAVRKNVPQPAVGDLPDGVTYFGRALNRSYFKPGASILSLGWTSIRPNPWQIAQPISGFDFQEKIDPNWKYTLVNGEYVRTRPAPPPPGLPQNTRKDEKAGPRAKSARPELREWLRWTHEAIVVGVLDLLDGPNVITFETYPKTGINRTSIANKQNRWSEFIGYTPHRAFDPTRDTLKINNLHSMLERQSLQLNASPTDDFLSFDIQPGMGEPLPLEIQGEPAAAFHEISAKWDSLTRRQKEVVALICQGYSTRAAATRLDTSTGSVQYHLDQAMTRFGLNSREKLKLLLANWEFGELEEDSSE